MNRSDRTDPESRRLVQDAKRQKNWKRWGPYLSERQWGTVREDYSSDGACWDYFSHDQARSRAYRWGEDGLLGITDRQCRLCFAIALWNGKDPILKERLFGLTNAEGNHGEDVKECYYYLDSTPTHSYMKALYKYPQAVFPYERLVLENRARGFAEPEFELVDTGVFDHGRYFDVIAEYAKASPDDVLIRITLANRGPDSAELWLLPTLWYRNTWSWGCTHEGCFVKPSIQQADEGQLVADHVTLGQFGLTFDRGPDGKPPSLLFTDNQTNMSRVFGAKGGARYVKDAFHDYVIRDKTSAVNNKGCGTKAAGLYRFVIPGGDHVSVRMRLFDRAQAPKRRSGALFERIFQTRINQADAFYAPRMPGGISAPQSAVARQAYAGLLWTKQFYHYAVQDWMDGDPDQPAPPASRNTGRNSDWRHLFNRDVLSVPDKWEYPWYAAWDLAFHMIPFARIDPHFAKEQLALLLREWYMHPNGQIPAYEFAFSDVNPPVHAWACWQVYKLTAPRGQRDRRFLASCFQKLLLNFTWWVNRKDVDGKHLFTGGFLGLDNIGMFDRSRPLPTGGHLEQADGTAWMAFFCATMLEMALELAETDPVYEDLASKFFEHFVHIADAMNTLGGGGLWDEQDGFYYDKLHTQEMTLPLRIRSMVGLIPLFSALVLEDDVIDRLPGFKKRLNWFLEHRKDLAQHISYMEHAGGDGQARHRCILAVPSRRRLIAVLSYLLSEDEFLSPFGVRSLSKAYLDTPFECVVDSETYRVRYTPGESTSAMFGGNSNWRGPVWFPLNYLLVEALQRWHYFYGDQLQVECPIGSGRRMNLRQVAGEIASRLTSIFLPAKDGVRPCHGADRRYTDDPHFRDLLLFHEYFHGDTGCGLGASHQTGWTALVVRFLEDL